MFNSAFHGSGALSASTRTAHQGQKWLLAKKLMFGVKKHTQRRVRWLFAMPLLLLAHQPASSQTTYFVDAINGSDGNSGKSSTLAWKTLSKVNGSAYLPGDIIAFKRGQMWVGGIIVPSSGISGSPITYGAYGTGSNPIITTRDTLKKGKIPSTWSQSGLSNVWATKNAFSGNISRIWLNGMEVPIALNTAGVNSTNRFYYTHSGGDSLYLFATANPATFFNSIEVPFSEVTGANQTLLLIDRDWVTFDGLDIQGGGYKTVSLSGADHITIKNCNVGCYANNEGIVGDEGQGIDKTSDSCIVSGCVINSGATIFYNTTTLDQTGAADGINLRYGASGWEISKNVFIGWYHAGVQLLSDDPSRVVQRNYVHNNRFDGGGISYCRAFASAGKFPGCVRGNRFGFNIAVRMTIANQIGGDSNSVYYNLVNGVIDTLSRGNASGFSLEPMWDGAGWCKGNRVLNNAIYGAATYGIEISDYNASTDTLVAGNEVSNNIAANCGLGLALNTHNSFVKRNTIKNNVFFKKGSTIVVGYRERLMSVATLNTQNALGDIISANMQVDPMFVSNTDFHLQPGSPCRKAGIGVGLTVDFDGNAVMQNSPVDIGAYQMSTITGPATGYGGNQLRTEFLAQNYPNPFNPTTSIGYNLSRPSMVNLDIFDTLGRLVKTLVSEREEAGYHEVRFDGSHLGSGVYFYRLKADAFIAIKRLLLLR
jgi:hypothetical protein